MSAPAVFDPAAAAPEGDSLYEVIDGQRVELPPMSAFAARVAFELARQVGNFAEAHDLGVAVTETLFRLPLPAGRNRRPAAAFVSFGRWAKGRPMPRTENAWDVVPDLAVEVVSPTDLADELMTKVAEYFQAGVRAVWVLYPGSSLVQVYDSLTTLRGLTAADELGGGPVLPGFRLPVAALFPGPAAP